MSERGQLIYLRGPKQLEVMEFPVPSPTPGGIIAQVVRANVCGSELHIWKGHHPTIKQAVLGHEMLGRVSALGAGVEADFAGIPLQLGDRIVTTYFACCRKCRGCRLGNF